MILLTLLILSILFYIPYCIKITFDNSKLANKYELLHQNTIDRTFDSRSLIFDVKEKNSNVIYKAKFMNNQERYNRELEANKRIIGSKKQKAFVIHESSELITESPFLACLILERGFIDLQTFSHYVGPLYDDINTIKIIGNQLLESITTIHNKNLIWTDCKISNFVAVGNDGGVSCNEVSDIGLLKQLLYDNEWRIKAVDLESCVDLKSNIQDFSPEILAPEQLSAFSSDNVRKTSEKGFKTALRVDNVRNLPVASQALDLWALGIILLHLHNGNPPITADPNDMNGAINVISSYIKGENDLGMNEVNDVKLLKLLKTLLAVEPADRGNSSTLKNKAFFK